MMATFGNALAFWYMGTMVDKISQVWLSANRNHSDSIFFVCIVPAIDPVSTFEACSCQSSYRVTYMLPT